MISKYIAWSTEVMKCASELITSVGPHQTFSGTDKSIPKCIFLQVSHIYYDHNVQLTFCKLQDSLWKPARVSVFSPWTLSEEGSIANRTCVAGLQQGDKKPVMCGGITYPKIGKCSAFSTLMRDPERICNQYWFISCIRNTSWSLCNICSCDATLCIVDTNHIIWHKGSVM